LEVLRLGTDPTETFAGPKRLHALAVSSAWALCCRRISCRTSRLGQGLCGPSVPNAPLRRPSSEPHSKPARTGPLKLRPPTPF